MELLPRGNQAQILMQARNVTRLPAMREQGLEENKGKTGRAMDMLGGNPDMEQRC